MAIEVKGQGSRLVMASCWQKSQGDEDGEEWRAYAYFLVSFPFPIKPPGLTLGLQPDDLVLVIPEAAM